MDCFWPVSEGEPPSPLGPLVDQVQGEGYPGAATRAGKPAVYGSFGIVTFQVNQDGVVFQKNLGPNTARVAAAWTRFDPDLTWARINISD